MDSTDRNLVDAYLGGETTAFEQIIRRHGPAVLGYLTKMTHNPDKAEDLFQETFHKAYRKAGTFRGDHLRPWLLAIATNTALTDRRRTRRLAFVSLDCSDGAHCPQLADPDTAADPRREILLEERKGQVRRALMSLPEKQRAAVILYYYHKLTYPQIADALGCTLGTVKTSMFRALKTLAGRLPSLSGGIEECRI